MTKKFQAGYRIKVYSKTSTVTVEYPLTMHASITRGVMCESSKATIQLYNLAPGTREQIFQDVFTFDSDKWKYIEVDAGYDGTLTQIFAGRILQAYSHRAGGSTDVITEIEAQALDIFNSYTSHTFAAGTTYQEAFNIIAADFPNAKIGNVGTLEGTFKTPTTFEGNTLECLNTLTGGNAFVDGATLNALMNNEVIDVPVPVIGDDSGLLETPIRRDANLNVKMLFEPTLIAGQLLEIKSSVSPVYNGQYKVQGFTHDLVISGSEAGSRTTTVDLYIGPCLPGAETELTDGTIQNNFNKVKGYKVEPVTTTISASARDTYNYVMKHNGKLPSTWITNRISWENMLGNDNNNSDRLSGLTLAICANCYTTATTLDNFLLKNNLRGKLTVNSGWRSTRVNNKWKGKPQSKHLKGLAIDWKMENITRRAYNIIQKYWNYGYAYNGGSFIHTQIDSTKGRVNDK